MRDQAAICGRLALTNSETGKGEEQDLPTNSETGTGTGAERAINPLQKAPVHKDLFFHHQQ